MKIDELKDKTLLLFGKPGAFERDEFDYQLHTFNITVLNEYSDSVSYIVEGRLMTPYEQNESDRLYEKGLKEKFISIDVLEETLIENIDADSLLMSLKLSHDRVRLLSYIKNPKINDALFFQLMKLYDWQNEGFFENDENRDVTAALISRFYENIERNHNVQYAALGLMHLIEQTTDGNLIEAISTLSPIKNGFSNASLYPIILSIAKNSVTPDSVLKILLKNGNLEIRKIIASKENLDADLQNILFSLNEEQINISLCKNPNLAPELVKQLQENFSDIIAENLLLDNESFEFFSQISPKYLAKNKTLTKRMQDKLLSLNNKEVTASLATNSNIDENIADEILLLGDDEINLSLFSNEMVKEENLREAYLHEKNYLSLAGNSKTPEDILRKLASEGDIEIIKALCKNPSTPVDLLYEFRLDQRLERLVSQNEAFADHIKTQNIGWQD
ncbi:hypothetical protein [Sulfurimonas sp. HSL-1716]|uniref:hypothetical protein n=1 Tax=Hydrocurvibacter sulfurireducens TaxID=3131937 RepID=UPI0031F7ECDE